MSVDARREADAAALRAVDTILKVLGNLGDEEQRLRVLRTALAFHGVELASADHFMVVRVLPDGGGLPVGLHAGHDLTCGPGTVIHLHDFASAEWLRGLAWEKMPPWNDGSRNFEVVGVDGTTGLWKWLGGAMAGTGGRRRQLRALAGAGKRPPLPP